MLRTPEPDAIALPGQALISIPQVVKAVKALIAKGDQAAEKAEQYYKAAGLHLKTLKENKPEGVTWEVFVKEQCGVSYQRAYQLISIADGRTTLAETREKNKEANQRLRDRQPLSRDRGDPPATGSKALVESEPEPEDDDEPADPNSKHAAFLMRTELCLDKMRECEWLYGTVPPNFGPKRKSDIARAARAVATAWSALALTLESSL